MEGVERRGQDKERWSNEDVEVEARQKNWEREAEPQPTTEAEPVAEDDGERGPNPSLVGMTAALDKAGAARHHSKQKRKERARGRTDTAGTRELGTLDHGDTEQHEHAVLVDTGNPLAAVTQPHTSYPSSIAFLRHCMGSVMPDRLFLSIEVQPSSLPKTLAGQSTDFIPGRHRHLNFPRIHGTSPTPEPRTAPASASLPASSSSASRSTAAA